MIAGKKKLEAEIDALLAQDDTDSLIDALLSMPRAIITEDSDEVWEKVLHARLQERLARKMRNVLESQEGRKRSRSAA